MIGSDTVSSDDFADFWGRLARQFANQPDVTFGLMNEPHDMPAEQWLDAANAALARIRGERADNLVLVPGTAWTGAHSWEGGSYGTPNGEVMLGVVDPVDNFAYEVHQYFDDDFSGTKENCSRAKDAVAAIETFSPLAARQWQARLSRRIRRAEGHRLCFGARRHGRSGRGGSRTLGRMGLLWWRATGGRPAKH